MDGLESWLDGLHKRPLTSKSKSEEEQDLVGNGYGRLEDTNVGGAGYYIVDAAKILMLIAITIMSAILLSKMSDHHGDAMDLLEETLEVCNASLLACETALEDPIAEVCDPTTPIRGWGKTLTNTNYRDCDPINSTNLAELSLHCWVDVGSDVTSMPSVWDGFAYFVTWADRDAPEMGGKLVEMHIDTCNITWWNYISSYTGIPGDVARVTPAITEDGALLVLGSGQGANAGGAHVFAVHRSTGVGAWLTQVDGHPASIITASMVIANNTVYGGVSSNEEAYAAFTPDYECCSFRGSAFSLNAQSGALQHKFYTAASGITGNAVWGSQIMYDPVRQRVCFATGNNYEPHAPSEACQETEYPNECLADLGNFINAVICLDAGTFDMIWGRPIDGYEAWNVACIIPGNPNNNCDFEPGPDFDFGQAPMLGEVHNPSEGHYHRQALFIGQKSGISWALDYNTGDYVWGEQFVPGSFLGGYQWGSAVTPHGVIMASTNGYNLPHFLPNGTVTCSGSLLSIHPDFHVRNWQTVAPGGAVGEDACDQVQFEGSGPVQTDLVLARNHGPVSAVNDVVFAGAMNGPVYGYRQADGEILFSFNTTGSVVTAPTVWNGYAIMGSGYARLARPDRYVYVFSLGGNATSPHV